MPNNLNNNSNSNNNGNDKNNNIATPNHTPYLDAFKSVVTSRRSVRVFTDTPIPDDVLDDCLHLAMLAPNSSNLQPWEFYVIESADKRKQADKLCMNQNAAKTANKLIAIVANTNTWREHAKQILEQYPTKPVPKAVKDYYGKLIPVAFTTGFANVLTPIKKVAVKGHRTFKGPIKTPIYDERQRKEWAVNNAYLAAQNLMLALRAYGFDSCPMGGFDEPAMKELLNLNQHQHIAMMLGAGERSEKGIYAEQFRFDDSRFVHRI